MLKETILKNRKGDISGIIENVIEIGDKKIAVMHFVLDDVVLGIDDGKNNIGECISYPITGKKLIEKEVQQSGDRIVLIKPTGYDDKIKNAEKILSDANDVIKKANKELVLAKKERKESNEHCVKIEKEKEESLDKTLKAERETKGERNKLRGVRKKLIEEYNDKAEQE